MNQETLHLVGCNLEFQPIVLGYQTIHHLTHSAILLDC